MPRFSDPQADARRLSGEGGMTLIETLVATAMFVLVVSATLALFDLSQKTANSHLARSEATAAAATGLQQMDHELRGAYEVLGPTLGSAPTAATTATSNYLDVYVRNGSGQYRVVYNCSIASPTVSGDRACVRYTGITGAADNIAGAKGPAIVDRLLNGTSGEPVFTLSYPAGETRPDYAAVTVKVPAKGELKSGDATTIELKDGVYMPNLNFKK